MSVTHRIDKDILYIALAGRIDATNAAEVEEKIFSIKNQTVMYVIFTDFHQVSFKFHRCLCVKSTLERYFEGIVIKFKSKFHIYFSFLTEPIKIINFFLIRYNIYIQKKWTSVN